jgi:hypothetical protein
MITLSEYRKFNKQFTTRELPTVKVCGHKFNPDELPRNHCPECIFAFFNQDENFVIDIHTQYKTDKQALTKTYGSVFVRLFGRYMSTVMKMRRESEQH